MYVTTKTPSVERAVDDCIKERVLAEFLSKNRAEAIAMSIQAEKYQME